VVEGRVAVNGVVVEPNGPCLVDSFADHVSVDGRPISFVKPTPVWIALHKPKGYISTVEDDRGRRTVMDLVKHSRKNALVPVGRLDSQSTGLLILTNGWLL
jgi:23S rRNA pseudouridine2605 synthase